MSITSRTGIIDYGVGNVRSVANAIKAVGGNPILTSDHEELLSCDRLILPGVGAYAQGMHGLQERGLDILLKRVIADGMPLMGICLGMQLLTERSFEFGETTGLGIADGAVALIQAENAKTVLRLPHVAWKPILRKKDINHWIFDGVDLSARFYFIHSYAVSRKSANIVATAEYNGVSFGAVLSVENVVATQFHPEKSGPAGLQILKNFINRG